MSRLFLAIIPLFLGSQLAYGKFERTWSCRGYYIEHKKNSTRLKLKAVRINVLKNKALAVESRKWKVTISEGNTTMNTLVTFRPVWVDDDDGQVSVRYVGKSDKKLTEFVLKIDQNKTAEFDDDETAFMAVAKSEFEGIKREKWTYPVLSCVKGKWDSKWENLDDYIFDNELNVDDI